jgi:hypothetical protein
LNYSINKQVKTNINKNAPTRKGGGAKSVPKVFSNR